MTKTKLGTVGYVNMGEWNSETIYNKLKVVTYEGSSYASLIDNNIGNIPTDKNYWQLMASKGDKGDKPINGQDYNTIEDKEDLKNIVIILAKPDIDSYNEEKKSELDIKELELETKLEEKKDILVSDFDKYSQAKKDEFDNNAETKKEEINTIADGVKDFATAIQFATFDVDNDMQLGINTAEKLANVSFYFDDEKGELGVEII